MSTVAIGVLDEHCVERLHRRVRQERKHDLRLDRLDAGLAECLVDIASVRRLNAAARETSRRSRSQVRQLERVSAFDRSQSTFKRRAATQGSEGILRQTRRRPATPALTSTTPATLRASPSSKDLTVAPKWSGCFDDRDQHVVGNTSSVKIALSGALGESVELRQVLADQHEVLGVLQLRFGRRGLLRGLVGKRAEAAFLAGAGVADAALRRP